MKQQEGPAERFRRYATLEVGVGVLGILGAYLWPGSAAQKLAALLGVGASVLSSGVALGLKRWALPKSMPFALAMMGLSFGVRLLALVVGLAGVLARQADKAAFIIGFFSVYFVCQWLEVSYVLASRERDDGQGGL